MAATNNPFFGSNSNNDFGHSFFDSFGKGSGSIGTGDAINAAGNLAGNYWQDFGGLQPQVAQIFQQVLSGHAPEALLPLLSGIFGQIDTAKNTADRNSRDKLTAGPLAQSLMGNEESGIQQKAGVFQNSLSSIMSGALEAGSNAMMRTVNPVLALGGLRVSQKGANAGGGGKK